MIFYALYLLYGDQLYIAQSYPFVVLRIFLVCGDMSLFIADLLIVQMWYVLRGFIFSRRRARAHFLSYSSNLTELLRMERNYKIFMAIFMVIYFVSQLTLETVSAFSAPEISSPVNTFLGCYFAFGLLSVATLSVLFYVRLQKMLNSMTRKQRQPITKVI